MRKEYGRIETTIPGTRIRVSPIARLTVMLPTAAPMAVYNTPHKKKVGMMRTKQRTRKWRVGSSPSVWTGTLHPSVLQDHERRPIRRYHCFLIHVLKIRGICPTMLRPKHHQDTTTPDRDFWEVSRSVFLTYVAVVRRRKPCEGLNIVVCPHNIRSLSQKAR